MHFPLIRMWEGTEAEEIYLDREEFIGIFGRCFKNIITDIKYGRF